MVRFIRRDQQTILGRIDADSRFGRQGRQCDAQGRCGHARHRVGFELRHGPFGQFLFDRDKAFSDFLLDRIWGHDRQAFSFGVDGDFCFEVFGRQEGLNQGRFARLEGVGFEQRWDRYRGGLVEAIEEVFEALVLRCFSPNEELFFIGSVDDLDGG